MLERLAPRISEMGFDVIELPIENLGDWSPERTSDLLAQLGMRATTCAVMTDERDLTTDDGTLTRSTQAYLRGCVDAASRIGASVVAGPMYSPVGRTWRMLVSDRRALITRLAEALRPVADHAGERGVSLGLEPLNRFETSLINTVDQALDLITTVDSPALGICLDTFHMNIEEKDPSVATRRARGRVVHVQACGTDRGAPGADRFEWPRFMDALDAIGYSGAMCIESFTVENESIARAASIWRPLATTQDRLATDGLAILRSMGDRQIADET